MAHPRMLKYGSYPSPIVFSFCFIIIIVRSHKFLQGNIEMSKLVNRPKSLSNHKKRLTKSNRKKSKSMKKVTREI